MRKYLRKMAKARLKAMGIERVNRHMKDFWRRAVNDPDGKGTFGTGTEDQSTERT